MTVDDHCDAVHFEVPDLAAAVRLTRRLGRLWALSLQDDGDVNLVSVILRPLAGDLATLLRNVEQWVEEESLLAIRFAVDDRHYVLTAGEADWEATPAKVVG
jgi:hypothetical protein